MNRSVGTFRGTIMGVSIICKWHIDVITVVVSSAKSKTDPRIESFYPLLPKE